LWLAYGLLDNLVAVSVPGRRKRLLYLLEGFHRDLRLDLGKDCQIPLPAFMHFAGEKLPIGFVLLGVEGGDMRVHR
jgi:hypothetical protein